MLVNRQIGLSCQRIDIFELKKIIYRNIFLSLLLFGKRYNRVMKHKCSIFGCERPSVARGMCYMHWNRVQRGCSDMRPEPIRILGSKWKANDPRYKNKNTPCKVNGCSKFYYAKGFCKNHYMAYLRYGVPERPKLHIKCIVKSCENYGNFRKGLCKFHRYRQYLGTDLNRPKGNSGELNPRWNGGVSQYPNHSEMKRIRKVVLEEEKYTCYLCGKYTNHIHHLDGLKINHDRNNLRACCNRCNLKMAGPRKPYLSKYVKIYGKTLKMLATELKISQIKVTELHRRGLLKQIYLSEQVKEILF